MLKQIKFYLITAILAFILLELSIACMVHFGWLNILMPIYSMNSSEDFLPERSFIYGHRHQPNSIYEVKKNCVYTSYQFNSLGFREVEPNKSTNQKRVLVLGDSFMEGVAVREEERTSDLLEARTSIPHLNFAMADKGLTQACVIYHSIASTYNHDAIIISTFPANDLIDDDPNLGKNENSIRPCWVGDYPNYTLKFVPKDSPKQKEYSRLKHFLKSYTYTYDALFYLKESIRVSLEEKKYPKSGYFDFSQAQLNRLFYSLQKIKEKAKDIPIVLLCIPSHLDLIGNKDYTKSIELELKEFCDQNDIQFIGLFNTFKKASNNPSEEFFYSCDSHWNPKGHELVAKVLNQDFSFYTP